MVIQSPDLPADPLLPGTLLCSVSVNISELDKSCQLDLCYCVSFLGNLFINIAGITGKKVPCK